MRNIFFGIFQSRLCGHLFVLLVHPVTHDLFGQILKSCRLDSSSLISKAREPEHSRKTARHPHIRTVKLHSPWPETEAGSFDLAPKCSNQRNCWLGNLGFFTRFCVECACSMRKVQGSSPSGGTKYFAFL